MSAVRQVGIKMVVDAQSVSTELPRAAREFVALGASAEQGAARATRSLAQVSMSVRDIVQGAAGLHVVSQGIEAISNAITSMPRMAFDFSKNLEVSQVGMAGILGSMTAINGQQLDYNRGLQLAVEYVRKLNDDALRTAATSEELTRVFQALLAPGLGAKMTLEEIRQLTVVGTNAVKSMGLDASQVVQELRDLVAGGITPASSTLATALGLKDSDIAKAKASSEGLFKFLMDRLKGFEASSEAFGDTLKGRLDTIKEGATRVAAEGMEPLVTASKAALGEVSKLFTTVDENKNVALNRDLVDGIKAVSQAAVDGAGMLRDLAAVVVEHRDAVALLASAYAGVRLGGYIADLVAATAAKVEAAQASRLAAVQAAAEAAGNVEVTTTSRAKVAAYLAELSAKVANAEADAAAQTARLATLATTQEAIVAARAEVAAKLDSVRATMAQAEAQIAAARAAGAQSVALALLREGTDALTAAQARQAALVTELATLGKQQAGVQAAIAAATTAQTAAQNAAAASATQLAAAQGAASVAGRALSGVVGFLGGPIGIVTTALTLGVTAWTLWGNAGSDAERKVQGSVERSTPEIIADLDKQITKLNQRNALVAAGMGDIAKQSSQAADRLAELQGQIDNLQAGKGPSGGEALPEAARVELLQKLLAQYGTLAGKIKSAEEAQANLNSGAGKLTLTVQGTEQAWRMSIDGIKTATAIQQEYTDKLQASRDAFKAYSAQLETGPNANPEKLRKAQAEQAQVEKQLAQERDKKIKELGAAAATERAHAIDAEVTAIKHGYKLLAAQTADSLAEVESAKKQGLLSESEALEKRTALQLADIDAQRAAIESELALVKGRKDSAKKQAEMVGELAELAQKRTNIETQSARQQRELDGQAADELERRITAERAAAAQSTENLRVAKLDTLEIGKTGAALGALRQARVEDTAKQLEARAVIMDGIDLSGRASAALRKQAQDTRDLAKTQGYNESARMVYEYAKAIDEANRETQFELSLSTVSQRDREIALEQYRIAIDLKKRLEEIDAKNPADREAAERLKTSATEAAARAQAGVVGRVYAREWTRTVDQIDDTFRTGFADMLNRGEEGWHAFNKSLATSFKTLVANEIYKSLAQPFVVNIIGNLLGLTGLGGIAQTAMGGGGGLLGLASSASSLYTAGSSALNMLGFGAGAYGTASAAATAAAAGGSYAAPGMMAMVNVPGSAAAGAAASGGFSSLISAIPGWGWALGGLALLAGSGLFKDKSGTPHWGAGATYDNGTVTGGRDIYDNAHFSMGIQREYSAKVQPFVDGVVKGVGSTLDTISRAFGGKGGYQVSTAYADDTSEDPSFGSFRITQGGKKLIDWNDTRADKWAPRNFADGEEGQKLYLAEIAKDTRKVLLDMELPSWAHNLIESIGEAASMDDLAKVVDEIGKIQNLFVRLGDTMVGFANMTDLAFEALLRASGGADALAANADSFYKNFYADDERKAIAKRQLNDQLKDLGVDINLDDPEAQAKYRKLVEDKLAQANVEEANRKVAKDKIANAVTAGGIDSMKDKDIASLVRDALGPDSKASDADIKAITDGIAALDTAGMSTDKLTGSISELLKPVVGTGKSAADTAAALLGLNGVFKEVTSSAEDVAAAEKARKDAAEKAQREAQDAAWALLQRSVEAERTAAQARVEAAQERVDADRAIMDALRGPIDTLRGNVEATRAMTAAAANKTIDDALAVFRGPGYLPDAKAIGEAAQTAASGITTSGYSSRLDYEAANMILANKLEVLHDGAEKQLSTDELALEQAKATVDYLDRLLKQGREALDVARGIDTRILTADQAWDEFRKVVIDKTKGTDKTTGGGGGGSGAGGTDDSHVVAGPVDPNAGTTQTIRPGDRTEDGGYYVEGYFGSGYGSTFRPSTDAETEKLRQVDKWMDKYRGTGDVDGLLNEARDKGFTLSQLATVGGWSYADLVEVSRDHGIPRFAAGGLHGGGVRMVGEDGPELEVTGPSRIYNAQQTQQLLAGLGDGGGDTAKLLQELITQSYIIGRRQIELLQTMETLARKSDATGVLQREPA